MRPEDEVTPWRGSCGETDAALRAWDPRRDLPERLAVHVGACPACRARFDALHPPALGQLAIPVDSEVRQRTLRAVRREPSAAGRALAVAGLFGLAAFVGSALWGPDARSGIEPFPPECPDELVLAVMECPQQGG